MPPWNLVDDVIFSPLTTIFKPRKASLLSSTQRQGGVKNALESTRKFWKRRRQADRFLEGNPRKRLLKLQDCYRTFLSIWRLVFCLDFTQVWQETNACNVSRQSLWQTFIQLSFDRSQHPTLSLIQTVNSSHVSRWYWLGQSVHQDWCRPKQGYRHSKSTSRISR